MIASMKVYVAGHAGMVGSAICRRLRAGGYARVVGRTLEELDLRRQAEVEAFFRAERPDVVVLAAARVGGILAYSTQPAEFIYDNLIIAANVIQAAWRHGTQQLVNLGSSCIYPKLAPQPIGENQLLAGPLEETNRAYAVAKIAALELCRHFSGQYGCHFVSLMPTNLYGPNDTYDLLQSHVLPALIRKFHLAEALRRGDLEAWRRDLARRPLTTRPLPGEVPAGAVGGGAAAAAASPEEIRRALAFFGVTGEVVTLWGTGSPRREFLHVDDLAEAAVFLLERPDSLEPGGFVNVGCGEDLPIRDLAELVRGAAGFGGRVEFDPSRPDGTPRKLLDVGKLRRLGWSPAIPLEEGVRTTFLEYARAN